MGNETSKGSSAKSSGGGLGLKSGPSSNVVQRHIENARKSRILQLKNTGIKKLPDALQQVSDVIRNLDLSFNKICEIPSYIGQFSHLKQLHLGNNKLENLPEEIGSLKNLEVLSVQCNLLSSLPSTLAACTSLKNINLSSNNFTSFPIELCQLLCIEMIDMSNNKITAVPKEISTCRATELNINQNRLAVLSASHLKECPNLKFLRVEENCLPKQQFTKDILEDSNISIIAFAGNLFQDKEFQGLDGYDSYQDRYTATKRKM
ncbi:unnamed protein product [Auanema sp. JU1783]|nr:unnamed protein product [Auanema sp. JU1783]